MISLKEWCITNHAEPMMRAYELAGNKLLIDQIGFGSKIQSEWVCLDCGQRWTVNPVYAVKQWNKGHFCPYCNHRRPSPTYNLEVLYPEVAAQWSYTHNGGLTPRECMPAINKSVYWICPFNHNHIWKDRIGNRTLLHQGCPFCKHRFHISTLAISLYYYLRLAGINCELEKRVGDYSIDILAYLPGEPETVAIELDGYYHHNDQASYQRDIKKDIYLKSLGYRVLRIKETAEKEGKIYWNSSILYHPQGKVHKIWDQLIFQVIKRLSGRSLEADTWKDHWKIMDLLYHEQRLRTLAVKFPELAAEWSSNNKDRADEIPAGTSEMGLWICKRCKREYAAAVTSRTMQGTGCPFCARKRATKETSLAATHPEIAKEWDYLKNAPQTPEDVLSGCDSMFWWICSKGHSYQSRVYRRTGTEKGGCPVCYHRQIIPETSLAYHNPRLAALFNEQKNGLSADAISPYSNKISNWICPKGHEWMMSANRMQKILPERYCKVCYRSNLLKTDSVAVKFSELVPFWHPDKNSLAPDEVLLCSSQKWWYRCNYGHEWCARPKLISKLKSKVFCPICRKE